MWEARYLACEAFIEERSRGSACDISPTVSQRKLNRHLIDMAEFERVYGPFGCVFLSIGMDRNFLNGEKL
jgi:hypothetical protein